MQIYRQNLYFNISYMKKFTFTFILTMALSQLSGGIHARGVQDSTTAVYDSTRVIRTACGTTTQETSYVVPPVANFTKLLEGRVTGLYTTHGGGQPGSVAGLMIRGISTLSDDAPPLIVLDGAIYTGDVNTIDPLDIATITILKDAVATMRYGGAGANGVLTITTKKAGRLDKKKLTIDARSGIVTCALPDYKTIGSEKDYYEISWEAYRNSLLDQAGLSLAEAGLTASGLNTPAGKGVVDILGYNAYNVANDLLLNPVTGKLNTDASLKYSDGNWRKAMQRVASRQEYHATWSANGLKGNYLAAAGYLNENGFVKHTGYERLSARFNGELRPFTWLKGGLNIAAAMGTQQYANSDFSSGNNPFFNSLTMAPIYPIHYYNTAGSRETDPLTGKDRYDWGNPTDYPNSSIGMRAYRSGQNEVGSLEWDQYNLKTWSWIAMPYLELTILKQFRFRTQFSYNYDKQDNDQILSAEYGRAAPSGGMVSENKSISTSRAFSQTISWTKTLGSHHIDIQGGYERFKYDISLQGNTTVGTPPVPAGAYRNKTRSDLEHYFVTGSYNFKEKYFLNAGYGTDGSSNRAPLFTWKNHWAAGLAWKINGESFLSDVSWIEDWKLKCSYGKQTYSNPLPGQNLFGDAYHHTNIGLDLSLWNNRLGVGTSYFIKQSDHLAGPPASAGSDDPVLTIANRGIELNLSATLIRKSKINWDISLNLTHLKNEITQMPDGMDTFIYGSALLTKGNSVYNFYLPESAGVDPEQGYELYYYTNASGQRTKTSDYELANATGRKNLGSPLPKLFGSLVHDLQYGPFSISLMFTFGVGGKYYDAVYQELMNTGYPGQNYSEDILNRWTPDNRSTDVPRLNSFVPTAGPSSRFLTDASYLNWRNVSVEYTFRRERLKKLKLKNLKVYITGDNIMLFSARKGMDPQASFTGNPDYGYRPARTIIAGITAGL